MFKAISNQTNEQKRVQLLRDLEILDTPTEQGYDDIVKLAAQLSGCPVALVTFMDIDRQWFKAKVGVEMTENTRENAFCKRVIEDGVPIIVNDMHLDLRFCSHPMVTGDPHVRFYAGFPLTSRDGYVLGSLCVFDFKPKEMGPAQTESLYALARQIGSLLELRATARDLFSRDQQLRDQSEQISQIAQNIEDVIWLRDEKNGKIMFVNPAYEKIWERPQQLAFHTEEYFLSTVHPEDRDRVRSKLGVAPSGSYEGSYRIVTPSGKTKWILAKVFPIRDFKGKIVRFTGICSDITERVLQDKLIEEQRLKMLQSARLSSLGEMASGIAHEINNPLAIIQGTSQLMKRLVTQEPLDAKQINDCVAKVEKTVSRIAKIISGLRAFARDGDNDPFTTQPVQSIIQETFELCFSRFKHHGVELKIELPDADVLVQCRSVQISQVLGNLLNNAFDAVAKENDKWVELCLSEEGNEVLISVSDSGPGVPDEIKHKIMQPFCTTKAPGKGTGLGLSLSRGIIGSHHGELRWAEESKHTRFEIRLPKHQTLERTA